MVLNQIMALLIKNNVSWKGGYLLWMANSIWVDTVEELSWAVIQNQIFPINADIDGLTDLHSAYRIV